MTACSQCGGPVTLIATIDDPAVIAKILAHLGLPTKAPPRSPALPCPLETVVKGDTVVTRDELQVAIDALRAGVPEGETGLLLVRALAERGTAEDRQQLARHFGPDSHGPPALHLVHDQQAPLEVLEPLAPRSDAAIAYVVAVPDSGAPPPEVAVAPGRTRPSPPNHLPRRPLWTPSTAVVSP